MESPRTTRGWCVLYSHVYSIAEPYKECRVHEFESLLKDYTDKNSYYMYWMADYPKYIEDPPQAIALLESIRNISN